MHGAQRCWGDLTGSKNASAQEVLPSRVPCAQPAPRRYRSALVGGTTSTASSVRGAGQQGWPCAGADPILHFAASGPDQRSACTSARQEYVKRAAAAAARRITWRRARASLRRCSCLHLAAMCMRDEGMMTRWLRAAGLPQHAKKGHLWSSVCGSFAWSGSWFVRDRTEASLPRS